jgi:hypothetical protein
MRAEGLAAVALLLALAGPGWGAEEAAQKAREQNRLLRQQQQDEFQLRMQQQQHRAQNPPADAHARQALEQLEINQQLRQRQLHERQRRELQVRPEAPSDDEGASRAKAQIERQRAEAESRRQLQQFDRELQAGAEGGKRNEEKKQLPGAGTPPPGTHVGP